jgi:hypothetical protein
MARQLKSREWTLDVPGFNPANVLSVGHFSRVNDGTDLFLLAVLNEMHKMFTVVGWQRDMTYHFIYIQHEKDLTSSRR